MEKYAVPVAPISENPNPIPKSHWKRSLIELNGKLERNYIRSVSPLLTQSYSEIGAFPHAYFINQSPCRTHITQFHSFPMMHVVYAEAELDGDGIRLDMSRLGVSALEFTKNGYYLASVTRSGCLTVHDFESLYCQSNGSVVDPGLDEEKQVMHISLSSGINAVRWNPADQYEIACTSLSNDEISIFDIGYDTSQVPEVLRKRPTVSVHGSSVRRGLSDIALFDDGARVLASDTCGVINMWDRRVGNLPQIGLTTNATSGLTSIQLIGDQGIYGASKSGFIYVWDLRGGRSSSAIGSQTEVQCAPLTSVKLASLLNQIGPLKAQSNILPKEIQSIDINPTCPYQLGFHLEDGWSGVLDTHTFQVSHIHCPPPWMDEANTVMPICPPRKSSWLLEHSIYAVGSASSNGLHLLDMYPHPSSPCHVDYDDSKSPKKTLERNNIFVPLSERVTACATHPLNGAIVTGTVEASLLMISQKHLSFKEDDVAAATSRLHITN
ncbi:uncharacterized protein [Rutidosis leptorrhynchoides]|uniref:uncharacterized protein n=1 Tax=Rutidosis leptorrhynchoides TaxID=125765 RepID=UPI003A98E147